MNRSPAPPISGMLPKEDDVIVGRPERGRNNPSTEHSGSGETRSIPTNL